MSWLQKLSSLLRSKQTLDSCKNPIKTFLLLDSFAIEAKLCERKCTINTVAGTTTIIDVGDMFKHLR